MFLCFAETKNEYSLLQKDVRLGLLRLFHWAAKCLFGPRAMGGVVLEVDPHHHGFQEPLLFPLQVWSAITVETMHLLFDYCVFVIAKWQTDTYFNCYKWATVVYIIYICLQWVDLHYTINIDGLDLRCTYTKMWIWYNRQCNYFKNIYNTIVWDQVKFLDVIDF